MVKIIQNHQCSQTLHGWSSTIGVLDRVWLSISLKIISVPERCMVESIQNIQCAQTVHGWSIAISVLDTEWLRDQSKESMCPSVAWSRTFRIFNVPKRCMVDQLQSAFLTQCGLEITQQSMCPNGAWSRTFKIINVPKRYMEIRFIAFLISRHNSCLHVGQVCLFPAEPPRTVQWDAEPHLCDFREFSNVDHLLNEIPVGRVVVSLPLFPWLDLGHKQRPSPIVHLATNLWHRMWCSNDLGCLCHHECSHSACHQCHYSGRAWQLPSHTLLCIIEFSWEECHRNIDFCLWSDQYTWTSHVLTPLSCDVSLLDLSAPLTDVVDSSNGSSRRGSFPLG